MYACWRKSDAFDPEIFAAGAASVLAEYALDIVDLVCDPRTGLPSRLGWPPTIKEIRDACDAIVTARKEKQDRNKSLQRQFAEREEYLRQEADRKNHPTAAELVASGALRLQATKAPLPADRLWARYCEAGRGLLHPEAEAILVLAGYDLKGPDEQEPKGSADAN